MDMVNKNYVFIDHRKEKIIAGYVGTRLEEIHYIPHDHRLYNIYFGRIQKYIPNIDAYFVELDQDKIGFLKNPVIHRKVGDEIFVQIIKIQEGDKRDRCIDNIFLKKNEYLFYPLGNYYKKNKKDISLEKIPKDIQYYFDELWEKLKKEKNFLPIPRLVLPSRMEIYDLLQRKSSVIITNDKEIKKQLNNIVKDREIELIKDYKYEYDKNISKDLLKCKMKRIDLASGAEIIWEKTHAMTVIDINSKQSQKDTLEINREALEEILWLLKLRDTKGIIICDMINMTDDERQSLEETIYHSTEDPKVQYHGMSNLGLMEFTRS
ncbi:MAG: ribonuclease E/G [Tissierellia bacterium]|nr:ribonuclease E/G [Tissierellia bacterium]